MMYFTLVLFLMLLLVITLKYIRYSKKSLYEEVINEALDEYEEYLYNLRHNLEHLDNTVLENMNIQNELIAELTKTVKEMSNYFLPDEFEETESLKEKDFENAVLNNIDIYDGTESGQDDLKKYL